VLETKAPDRLAVNAERSVLCAREAPFSRPGETPGAEAPCHPRENSKGGVKPGHGGGRVYKYLAIVRYCELL